ncbi:MAG: aldehyde ferredoxin oxidoreductase family protein [Zestosphaera sp.]
MVKGISGRIALVDLSNGSVKFMNTSAEHVERFVGGAGYGTWLLFKSFAEHVTERSFPEPLSPENPLIMMTGPLTGLTAFSFKTAVVSRSPLTRGLGKSIFSGSWGATLKKAGLDGVVVKGAAERPAHIVIDDGHVDVKDASNLWGRDVMETVAAVRSELGEGFRTITIGPAGERLVKIASIVSSERRVAGRTGMGAVMGSKKLKAISVRGSGTVEVHNPEELVELNKKWLLRGVETARGKALREYGTVGGVSTFVVTGNLPMRHWTLGFWDKADNISGKTYMEKHRLGAGRKACGEGVMCSILCERAITYDDPRFGSYAGKGPEYETAAMLGSNLLVEDPVALAEMNNLCDRLGLDTISTGEVLAWLTEAREKGLVGDELVEGMRIEWGNHETYLKLIKMTAFREGIGDALAEGAREASRRFGRGAERIALHVKGLEVPAHNPRLYKSLGLSYATSNRGACHLQGSPMFAERGIVTPEYGITAPPKTPEERVNTVIIHQNMAMIIDSATICKFGTHGVADFNLIADVWNSVTGMRWDRHDILKAGERIWYLERIYNYLVGFTNRDDSLPDRFLMEPVNEGGAKGLVCDDFDVMLMKFYEERKLRTKPELAGKLREIGLTDLLEVLEYVRLW